MYSCSNELKCNYTLVKLAQGTEIPYESGKIHVHQKRFDYLPSSNKDSIYSLYFEGEKIFFNGNIKLLECFVVDQFYESEFYLYESNEERIIISWRFGLVARKNQMTSDIFLLQKVCTTEFNSHTKAVFIDKMTNYRE
ncbi:hypothetical protein GTQ40_07560 [Flavobacteriaceae bacterium R38]|nr:hypothetical protein [Flavobacteriaceae bacterium R38]